MLKRILAALAVLSAMLVAPVAIAAPAHAGNGWPGGQVYHDPNDAGFNGPIIITCDYWTKPSTWLYLGATSKTYCRDADGIYVPAGQQVSCHYSGMDWMGFMFDATGWHKITDVESYTCVSQLD